MNSFLFAASTKISDDVSFSILQPFHFHQHVSTVHFYAVIFFAPTIGIASFSRFCEIKEANAVVCLRIPKSNQSCLSKDKPGSHQEQKQER